MGESEHVFDERETREHSKDEYGHAQRRRENQAEVDEVPVRLGWFEQPLELGVLRPWRWPGVEPVRSSPPVLVGA